MPNSDNQPQEQHKAVEPLRRPTFGLKTVFAATLASAVYWQMLHWLGPAAPLLYVPVGVGVLLWLLFELTRERGKLDWLAFILIMGSIGGLFLVCVASSCYPP